MRALLFAVLALPVPVLADPPSPDDVAKIQYEQNQASAEIDKKYGNRKSSELSSDERRAMIKEKAAAERDVLDKHGVNAKDFARGQAKQSLDDRAKTRDATEKLQKDADAKKKDTAAGDAKGKEIVIERGSAGAGANPDSDANEAAEADRAAGYGKGKRK